MCVRCMYAFCSVEERTVGVRTLSGVSKCSRLGVAYCLTKPGLAVIQCKP